MRTLAAGKHNRTSAASADHVESLGRDLLHVHGATPLLRVIDDLLQTFGPLPALTANDLAAAEDPVSTLMEVAETFRFEPLPLSELMLESLPVTRVEAESFGRDLFRENGAAAIIPVIDRLLQVFGPHLGLTANDLGAAEDPVSTLAEVAETYEVTARDLSGFRI